MIFRWYIRQGPYEWQICATTRGLALWKWKARAGYADRTPVEGQPDEILQGEKLRR